MELSRQIDANENDQQRVYRLMAALASSGCPLEGTWLEWFHTNVEQTLGKGLVRLLVRLRQHQRSCFLTPAPHDRLEAVRALMQVEGIDALLVGHDDENLNEYVTPGGERLCWLTGFRGSAGLLLLGLEQAVLFVDGRYRLQAPQQVDPHFVQVKPFCDEHLITEISAFSRNHEQTGVRRVGVDDRLFSARTWRRLQQQCADAGHELCVVSQNLIDRVWENRPPEPISPVEFVDEALHGQSSADKLAQILPLLSARRADCLVLQAPESIAWLLNVRAWDIDTAPLCLSRLVVHAEGSIDWFVLPDRLESLRGQSLPPEVYMHPMEDYLQALHMLGEAKQSVWIDPARISAWAARMLQESGAMLIEADDPVWVMASCLSGAEIAAMHQAHLWDGVALVRFMADLARDPVPAQESELVEKLHDYRRQQPEFLQDSFKAIVAVGGNSAICHYRPDPDRDARVRLGDVMLIDSGGHYRGGTTDVTRVIAYDQGDVPLSADFRHHYTAVLKGLIAISSTRFPAGTTGAALDSMARRPLWQCGLDYDHGTGHGVGANLMVHFGQQSLSKKSTVALRPGMVVSLEPGVYFPERYGIRLENLAVVVEDSPLNTGSSQPFYRFDNLTWVPFVRRMIDIDALTGDEIDWLNDYHARVYRHLAPLLTREAAAWLAQQTQLYNPQKS